MKYVHRRSEMPVVPHYAIITYGSRSEQDYDSPYYYSYNCITDYEYTLDKEEFETEVLRRLQSKYGSKEFDALYVTPCKIQTNIIVDIP